MMISGGYMITVRAKDGSTLQLSPYAIPPAAHAAMDDATERYKAGLCEPPQTCDICQDVIPDGTGWLTCDLLTCDTCERRLREAQRQTPYAPESRTTATIRGENEPGEDEKEK